MKDTKSGKLTGRQPLANKRINLSRQAREQLLLEISSEILHAKLNKGAALKKLRLQLFSASQADYATMIGIGRKALSEKSRMIKATTPRPFYKKCSHP